MASKSSTVQFTPVMYVAHKTSKGPGDLEHMHAHLRKLMLLPARRMVLAIFLLMKVGRMSSFSLYPLRHRSSDKPACINSSHTLQSTGGHLYVMQLLVFKHAKGPTSCWQ